MIAARIASILFLLVTASATSAHTRSESWSQWQVRSEGLSGIVTVPSREVTRLPEAGHDSRPLPEIFAGYLAVRVTAKSGAANCDLRSSEALAADEGYVRVALSFRCADEPTAVVLPILFEHVQGHTHFARRAGTLTESLLTETQHRFDLAPSSIGSTSPFRAYLRLGAEHILSGPDHLAFLMALLLAAASWRNILITVTGFTLGHSLTLSLAVTGIVQTSAPRVEAFIGFTIALVAAETIALRNGYWQWLALTAAAICLLTGLAAYLWTALPPRGLVAYAGLALFSLCYLMLAAGLDDRTRRSGVLAAVAVLFGLIHGLGFAGFLLSTGLPEGAALIPLAAFNLGVEAGQLLALALAIGIAQFTIRLVGTSRLRFGQMLCGAALCGLGLAWFAGRSLS